MALSWFQGAEIIFCKHRTLLVFSTILQHWHGPGSVKPDSIKTKTHLFFTINLMFLDNLARVSTAMPLTLFSSGRFY